MYLSYSGYKTFSACPFAYWQKYINKTTTTIPDNRVNMLFGGVTGIIFERFYNDKLWMTPDPVATLIGQVEQVTEETIARELKSGPFDWTDKKANYKSPAEVIVAVKETIPMGVQAIRHHRLLGPNSRAEVKLDTNIGGHRLAGRADFVIRRLSPHGDLTLLDGKGSKWRDKYIDRRQLRWYAMLYRDHHKTIPDRIGFLYWRFAPEEAVDWVECTAKDVDSLQGAVLDAIDQIDDGSRRMAAGVPSGEAFPAHPNPDCKFCPYLDLCASGKAYVNAKPSTEVSGGTGVEDDVGM